MQLKLINLFENTLTKNETFNLIIYNIYDMLFKLAIFDNSLRHIENILFYF